jgi:hypothetical protein
MIGKKEKPPESFLAARSSRPTGIHKIQTTKMKKGNKMVMVFPTGISNQRPVRRRESDSHASAVKCNSGLRQQ